MQRFEESPVHYGNIPVNGWRTWESNDMEAANAIERRVQTTLRVAAGDRDLSDDQKRILIALAWTYEDYKALGKGSHGKDPENINAQMVARLDQMVSLVREYRVLKGEADLPASAAFCKSGKDRAGYVRSLTFSEAYARQAMLSNIPADRLETVFSAVKPQQVQGSTKSVYASILESIGRSAESDLFARTAKQASDTLLIGGHVQRVAAEQSPGCEGIKDSEKITPKSFMQSGDESLKDLWKRPTAKYNSKLPPASSLFKGEIHEHYIHPIDTFATRHAITNTTNAEQDREFAADLSKMSAEEQTKWLKRLEEESDHTSHEDNSVDSDDSSDDEGRGAILGRPDSL